FRLLAFGHIASSLVFAGVELDLFTLLDRRGPLTRPEIADALGLKEQPARILLNGLSVLGLLDRSETGYANSPLSRARLSRDSRANLTELLAWQHHIVYRGLFHLADAMRAGTNVGLQEFAGPGSTIYERLGANERLEGIFHRAMTNLSEKVNAALVEHV